MFVCCCVVFLFFVVVLCVCVCQAEVPGCHGTNNTSCRDHIIQHFSLLQCLSHRHLQPILALCLCSKKGEVLAGGVVSGDVRGHPPLLEEGREMPAVTELQVAIIERFHEKGSLKDYMHMVRGGLGDCVRWVWHHCYTKS